MEYTNFIREIIPRKELIGRDEELCFLKESLYKKRMRNTILVGPAGCGKTAILEKFAYDMRGLYKIKELDIGACVAGTKYRGEFEQKFISFLDLISNEKNIILFIDEIHTIYKAGGSEGAVDAANILKSYLSNSKITIIGATTDEEYRETIAKDRALSRRLSPVFVRELDDATNLKILINFNDNCLDETLVNYIYEKSKNLSGVNPDKAIEILDRCMAHQKFTGDKIKTSSINKIIKYMKEGVLK